MTIQYKLLQGREADTKFNKAGVWGEVGLGGGPAGPGRQGSAHKGVHAGVQKSQRRFACHWSWCTWQCYVRAELNLLLFPCSLLNRPPGHRCEEHCQVPGGARHAGPYAAALLGSQRRCKRAQWHPERRAGDLWGSIHNWRLRQVSWGGLARTHNCTASCPASECLRSPPWAMLLSALGFRFSSQAWPCFLHTVQATAAATRTHAS